jgi:acetyl esterase/lipase
MDPMALDLSARGWAVANVEYRRVDAGGGWPLPVEDTVAACETLIDLIEEGLLPAPLVLLGHSVGGQLVLLAARELPASALAGVVALAPVTDVVETWRASLGNDAARELLAVSPGDPMRIADAASPRFRLPIGAPIRVVHGANDARVPVEHSRVFAALAAEAGDDIGLHALPLLDHIAAIDPTGTHWPLVAQELRDLAVAR